MNDVTGNSIGLTAASTVGFAIIAVFFGTFGIWSFVSPLQSAAIAPGVVNVESQRKSIQHLEGGIVAAIRVHDGDAVAAGDVLLELDQTQPRASQELIRWRLLAAQALEARLKAERDGSSQIDFAVALHAAGADPQVRELREVQERMFSVRSSALAGETAILEQRIGQLEAERQGLGELVESLEQQRSLTADEVDSNRNLFEKGLSGKARLRELQKELTEIKGRRSQARASIARIGQRIAETRLQIVELGTQHLNDVVEQLRLVQGERVDLAERLRAAEDVLARTVVRAPLAGTVVGLHVHTVGGVIAPGERLLDIVPQGERLIVEARVDPDDIDIVEVGLQAQVRLTAFSQRRLQPLQGRVITLSADRLTEERTGQNYFLARVELLGDISKALGKASLYPGMQAEVMILTGARTPISYLLEPLAESLNRALRES